MTPPLPRSSRRAQIVKKSLQSNNPGGATIKYEMLSVICVLKTDNRTGAARRVALYRANPNERLLKG